MSTRTPSTTRLAALAATYADAIVAGVQREYPNAMHHTTSGPDDRPLPRELHPAFYGCFDWHSAVHMHYSLVRLLRLVPDDFDSAAAREVLDRHLTEDNLRREAEYLRAHPTWERPYGWGWALALADELAELKHDGDEQGKRWAKAARPLAETVAELMTQWLAKQALPVRYGMHSSSAFALERALPWAVRRASNGDTALLETIEATARRWFGTDRDAPVHQEPSGTDFLSPALTEASLMIEVLGADEFATWLARFMPQLSFSAGRLGEPAVVADPSDGHLAHLDGLNLTRAWMLRRIAAALPRYDLRYKVCLAAATANAEASLDKAVGGDWMGEHWLATYAICALTAPLADTSA